MTEKKLPYLNWGQKGQALVPLLIFVATAIIITSAAIAIAIINIQSTSQFTQGQQAYDTAESGAEDAILKLVRNSSFGSSYSVSVGNYLANVVVSPSGQATTKTITAEGVVNNFRRKIQVSGQFNSDGTFSVVSWN